MSFGIGAYGGSSWTSTIVRAPPLSSSFDFTLPTFTPAMRTSASSASVAASGHVDVNR